MDAPTWRAERANPGRPHAVTIHGDLRGPWWPHRGAKKYVKKRRLPAVFLFRGCGVGLAIHRERGAGSASLRRLIDAS